MDSQKPDISVIIPAYNIEGYIERAIQSALSQEGVTVEVIVVDDCSTDNTVAVAKNISDPRLTVIVQGQNGGPSVARNKGFSIAKGEWISILDGDDVLSEGRLKRCLSRGRNTQSDCVVDNLLVVPDDGSSKFPMFNEKKFNKFSTLSLADFIKGNQSFLGGYTLGYLKPMFRADFLKKYNLSYSTEIRIGEDYLLMSEILACGARCSVEPSIGYLYTVRNTSISHRLDAQSVTRIEKADQYFLSKYTIPPEAMAAQKRRNKRLREAFFFTELVSALKNRDAVKSLKIFISCPIAIIYLWRPVAAKIEKLLK